MRGHARAPAAGTVLNALATGTGAAFAIDEYVRATVDLSPEASVAGHVEGAPDADTALVERCVALVAERYGDGEGGTVTTESDVAMAAGLKSSSAAANAAVLATLSALDVPVGADGTVTRADAARLGVQAARETGVTVTGAFDDAAASMLGGVAVTDNESDELLAGQAPFADHALVWTPTGRAYSADADVERCRRVAPVADTVADLALAGDYGRAMTVNGFAFCAALDFPTDPMLEALPAADGVSLSGTGPSYVAVGEREALAEIRERWAERDGRTWLTATQAAGATSDP
jgi:shikimate kinase